MKSPNSKAAGELHMFLADPGDLSPAELHSVLEAEGVNATAFQHRLESARPKTPAPRLDAVAQQTKEKIRGFLAKFKSDSPYLPDAVYARDGALPRANSVAAKKQKRSKR